MPHINWIKWSHQIFLFLCVRNNMVCCPKKLYIGQMVKSHGKLDFFRKAFYLSSFPNKFNLNKETWFTLNRGKRETGFLVLILSQLSRYCSYSYSCNQWLNTNQGLERKFYSYWPCYPGFCFSIFPYSQWLSLNQSLNGNFKLWVGDKGIGYWCGS